MVRFTVERDRILFEESYIVKAIEYILDKCKSVFEEKKRIVIETLNKFKEILMREFERAKPALQSLVIEICQKIFKIDRYPDIYFDPLYHQPHVEAFYDSSHKRIYLLMESDLRSLLHELKHFHQDVTIPDYERRYWEEFDRVGYRNRFQIEAEEFAARMIGKLHEFNSFVSNRLDILRFFAIINTPSICRAVEVYREISAEIHRYGEIIKVLEMLFNDLKTRPDYVLQNVEHYIGKLNEIKGIAHALRLEDVVYIIDRIIILIRKIVDEVMKIDNISIRPQRFKILVYHDVLSDILYEIYRRLDGILDPIEAMRSVKYVEYRIKKYFR